VKSKLPDGGDLHDFGGGGNDFGVRREEFKDMVYGGLGTSAKIHGLQPAATFFTPPNKWDMRGRWRLLSHHLPLRSSFEQRPK